MLFWVHESYSGAESNPEEIEAQESSAEAMDSAKAETRMNMANPSAAMAARLRRV